MDNNNVTGCDNNNYDNSNVDSGYNLFNFDIPAPVDKPSVWRILRQIVAIGLGGLMVVLAWLTLLRLIFDETLITNELPFIDMCFSIGLAILYFGGPRRFKVDDRRLFFILSSIILILSYTGAVFTVDNNSLGNYTLFGALLSALVCIKSVPLRLLRQAAAVWSVLGSVIMLVAYVITLTPHFLGDYIMAIFIGFPGLLLIVAGENAGCEYPELKPLLRISKIIGFASIPMLVIVFVIALFVDPNTLARFLEFLHLS